MSRELAVDTETTGLYPAPPTNHRPWEAAFRDLATGDEAVLHVLLPRAQLATADPAALRLSRYYERFTGEDKPVAVVGRPDGRGGVYNLPAHGLYYGADAAKVIARYTAGATLVGVNPWFDAAMLAALLGDHGMVPAWHHRLVDVRAMAAGYLAGTGNPGIAALHPWDTDSLSLAIGVDPPGPEQRHTALGDVRWVRDIYQTVTGPQGGDRHG